MGAEYLADTNVLLRFADRDSAQHPIIRRVIQTLAARRDPVYMTPQNGIEFWAVATRPASKNALGWTLTETGRRLRLVERLFPLLPDKPEIYREWKRLVHTVGVSGIQVHDARLVAVMLANGIENILTFNGGDFARYAAQGIMVLDPISLADTTENETTL